MGGGGGLNVPKEIWSPAGGFYADPRNWRRNTLIAAGGILVTGYYIFSKSIQLEQRHAEPIRNIPSQRWAPHTFPGAKA